MPIKKKALKTRTTKKSVLVRSNLRHNDLPATVGLVKEVRAELTAQMRCVEYRLESRIVGLDSKVAGLDRKIVGLDSKIVELDNKIAGLDSKVAGLDSKIARLDSKIQEHDSKFLVIDSKLEKVLSIVHGTQALVEEQRGGNRIVLDALKAVIERQDRAEEQARAFQETLNLLAKVKEQTTQ